MRFFQPLLIILAVAGLLLPSGSLSAATDAEYIAQFINYQSSFGQINDPVPTLDEYFAETIPRFDEQYVDNIQVWVDQIADQQNILGEMGWTSSAVSTSLNDMYAVTGDLKYLRASLEITRISLQVRDDKIGRTTFWGESAPGWSTPRYALRWVIHPVHTAMITWGMLESLWLAQANPVAMAELGDEFDSILAQAAESIDWHNRQWVEGPASDEGYYIYKDNEPDREGQRLPFNRQSTMGRSLWMLYKLGGNPEHRDKAIKLATFLKRRLHLFLTPDTNEGVWFWEYTLPNSPRNNPYPWSQLWRVGTGDDLSHGSLSMEFYVLMANDGQVFTHEDMQALARTVTYGFARLDNGILFGNVAGSPDLHDPSYVANTGYWLRLTPYNPEVYDRIAAFMLKYQQEPRGLDLAKLVRWKMPSAVPQSWLYE